MTPNALKVVIILALIVAGIFAFKQNQINNLKKQLKKQLNKQLKSGE